MEFYVDEKGDIEAESPDEKANFGSEDGSSDGSENGGPTPQIPQEFDITDDDGIGDLTDGSEIPEPTPGSEGDSIFTPTNAEDPVIDTGVINSNGTGTDGEDHEQDENGETEEGSGGGGNGGNGGNGGGGGGGGDGGAFGDILNGFGTGIANGLGGIIDGIVSGIDNLLGISKNKKKEKEAEVRRKVEEGLEVAKKIGNLADSARSNYDEDVEELKRIAGPDNFKPSEIRELKNLQGNDHNERINFIDPQDLKPNSNDSQSGSETPSEDCRSRSNCAFQSAEQKKVADTKNYIKGAREYVKEKFTGSDRKTREGVLDGADSASNAADGFYKRGELALGDSTIELSRKMADVAVGATPILGDLVDIGSAIAGENLITGEKLSREEAIGQAALAIGSLVTGGYLGAINDVRKGAKILKEVVKEKTKIEAQKEARETLGGGNPESTPDTEKRSKERQDIIDAGEKRNRDYPNDFQTRNTKQVNSTYNSERDARNHARTQVGRDPIQLGDGKLRSKDGKWQYRAKPNDLRGHEPDDTPHVHIERLDPKSGEVLENNHLRW